DATAVIVREVAGDRAVDERQRAAAGENPAAVAGRVPADGAGNEGPPAPYPAAIVTGAVARHCAADERRHAETPAAHRVSADRDVGRVADDRAVDEGEPTKGVLNAAAVGGAD